MKNPLDVLRMKEQELLKVRIEIDALRIAAKLLAEETHPANGDKQDLRQLIEMP
jgi:hypothetical protein